MAYYRRNKAISDIIRDLVIYFIIGWVIFTYFGWQGLAVYIAVVIAGIIGISVVIIQYGKYKKRREEEKYAKTSCKHGIAGAFYGYKPCIKCQQEKAAEEQIARKRVEEEEARRRAEKERAYKEWVERIRLPEYLREMHPETFERLVCDLFRKMGYEVKHTPYSGDSGVDGYLKKDGDLSILQCKRVKGSVGEPILRDLFGTMHATGAKEGVVVTTGKVSIQARNWSRNKPIKILELDELVNLIRTHFREGDVVPEEFVPYENYLAGK